MKSKVLKIGTVLLTCVCLVSILVFPVSAVNSFSVRTHAITFSNSDLPLGATSYSNFGTNGYEFRAELGDGGYYPENDYFWRISFQVGGLANSFISFKMSALDEGFSTTIFNNVKCYVSDTAENWIECSTKVTLDALEADSNLTPQGYVSFKIPQNMDIYYILIFVPVRLVSPNYFPTLALYDFDTSSYDPLPDYSSIIDNQNQNAADIQSNQDKNTQSIIDNQNSNTQQQIQADKENTDKITNGWQGAENIDDSTANDFKDSESAALGGKTDAEIQEEVSNALDFDIDVFDSVKIGKIHSLFDNVLNVTGSWQSLFVLSLTLGLGAFLIGRRYG